MPLEAGFIVYCKEYDNKLDYTIAICRLLFTLSLTFNG